MARLHILSPSNKHSPAALAASEQVKAGDLIADFRRFPPSLWQVDVSRTCSDITSNFLDPPDYWTVARDWLHQFTEQTGLHQALSINGHSFWWTLNGQKFVPGLTDLGDLFPWIDYLKAIDQKAAPNSICVYGQHRSIVYLVRQVFPETKVKILPEAQVKRRKSTKNPLKTSLLIVRALLGIVYLVYSLFRRPDFCVFSGTGPLRYISAGPKQKLYDIFMGDVIQALKERGWRVSVVEKYGWNATWDRLMARGFYFPSDVIFLSSWPGLHSLGVARKWRQKWAAFHPQIVKHMHYRGYDISPIILPVVAQEFVHQGPFLEVMTRIWRCIFRLWQPKILYFNNSYGRSATPAIIAARQLNIHTVEQQHGVIGRNHICYLAPRELEDKVTFTLCDAMTVWGQHTQHLLVDAGVYSTEQMEICGSPRIDRLLADLPPQSETLNRLNFPVDVPIVLYTSNEFASGFLHEILDGIQNVPEENQLRWVIKLHQREESRSAWEEAIKERGLHNVRIVRRDISFYALLAVCDVHVSFASTTLIESAILGKPNLGLDISHTSDPAGYESAKAFLPVAPNRLGEIVHTILYNPEQRNALLLEQKKFARKWCLHDGKSVERIVRFLESRTSTRS